jgi:ankyrin repeat protein
MSEHDSSEPWVYESTPLWLSALDATFEAPGLTCRDREAICDAHPQLKISGLCQTRFHLEQCKQEDEIKKQILSGNYREMLDGLKRATPSIGIEWDKQRHTGPGVHHTLLTFCLSDVRCKLKIQMVHELLRLGASANATASNGLSPMTAAIIGFSTEDVKYSSWIHCVADMYPISHIGVQASLVEHSKLKIEGVQILTKLLDAGADVNNNDATLMETPLIAAARRNSIPCAEFLLSKGAKPDGHYSRRDYYASETNIDRHFGDRVLLWDPGKFTPMRMAIINSDPRMVHILLSWGADANKENEQALTPLHFAALALQLAAHSDFAINDRQWRIKTEMTVIALLIEFDAVETRSSPVLFNSSTRVITASDLLEEKGDIHLANFVETTLAMKQGGTAYIGVI